MPSNVASYLSYPIHSVGFAPDLESAEAFTRFRQEISFGGDSVTLGGQIDYPYYPRPEFGYPLLFMLPQAGTSRHAADHVAALALEGGYAVFRWDTRETGKSGGGGRGSATQDAVNAYEVALDQRDIARRKTIIAALGSGTGLLGNAYGLFARSERPHGALLIGNTLDARTILAIDTHVHIALGGADWMPMEAYGNAPKIAHRRTYPYGAEFTYAEGGDRMLMQDGMMNPDARRAIFYWLRTL